MKGLLVLMLAGCLLLAGPHNVYSSNQQEKQAQEAALIWLALVDDGQYQQSWQHAAKLFKNAVTEKQWVQQLRAVRGPMGGALSRELIAATFANTLPGAPDGEYVVIQFKSSFEGKKSATETVTPMKDPDGIWRVAGYYIK